MPEPHASAADGRAAIDVAVVGAGPVGLALALRLAATCPRAQVSLFDTRAEDKDVSTDARTLALSLGSVQLLQRLGAFEAMCAQAISEVHISQEVSIAGSWQREARRPAVRIRASDERVALLGAVLPYGLVVAPLQRAWTRLAALDPDRLHARFGTPVTGLKNVAAGVEIDAGTVETYDLVIVAEGGVFADQARKAVVRDYRQTAWVGTVTLGPGARPGVAYERFTRHGPAALLPLSDGRAALVWCVTSDDDPVAPLDDAQRLAVLNHIFPPEVGGLTSVTPLKRFPLGLNAERTLTDGRIVRIGNAAQTLHPVAGQGLNLGLRDAWELVHALQRRPDVDTALRHLEWQRAPDRWTTIAATDFLARSFTWRLPGADVARGLGLAALQALGPLKSALARHMMFGAR
jgi:2-octaprenyl-6-methoxyphenol hydroxylase